MRGGCSLRRRSWLGLCLLVPALTAGMMLAQDSPQPPRDLGDASLETLMNVEVYSASKHLQSVREAPSFVSIVTAEDIRNYGYRTLADILQSLPGFYVSDDHQYSNLGIRGFTRTSDYNTPFLLWEFRLCSGSRSPDATIGECKIVNCTDRFWGLKRPGSWNEWN